MEAKSVLLIETEKQYKIAYCQDKHRLMQTSVNWQSLQAIMALKPNIHYNLEHTQPSEDHIKKLLMA